MIAQNKTAAPPSPQPTSGSGESPTVSMAQANQAGRMGWLSVGLAAVGAYVVYSLSAATQSATSIQFAIIAFFVFLGLLAVRQAWAGIRAESRAFEANREKELDKELIERLVKRITHLLLNSEQAIHSLPPCYIVHHPPFTMGCAGTTASACTLS